MEFRECLRWLPDNMPETTEAIVVISKCGMLAKRLPHKKFNKKNNSYSCMREHVYKFSSNRGKQIHEGSEKIDKYGLYISVCIRDKTYSVHQLVAIAWIENPHSKPQVNHKNGIRHDNASKNLEWVTNRENVQHAWLTGLRTIERMQKIKKCDVEQMYKLRIKGQSNIKIAEQFGCSHETVRSRLIDYEDSI